MSADQVTAQAMTRKLIPLPWSVFAMALDLPARVMVSTTVYASFNVDPFTPGRTETQIESIRLDLIAELERLIKDLE